MTLTPVETLPVRKRYCYNKLQKLLKQFLESDCKIVRIDYDDHEYKNAAVLYASVYRSIQFSKCPIKLRMVNGEVYLLKT